MKITFLARSLLPGGAERQLVALAKEMALMGHQVSVLVFYGGGALEEDLRDVGVPIIEIEKKGRWDIPGFLFRLYRHLRNDKPNILNSYLTVPNILAVVMGWMIPSLNVVWGIRASNMALAEMDRVSSLSYRLEAQLSRLPDLIVVNSYAGREHCLSQGYPESLMTVIPNGIDTKKFVPDSQRRSALRREWAVDEEEYIVALIARIDPIKNHDCFLKAAALLSRHRQDVRFICVGGGDPGLARRLKKQAEDLGISDYLLWLGDRRDMVDVFNAVDLVTLTSFSEGFPNVIGEAMSCGVPCITVDVGDCAILLKGVGQVTVPEAEALSQAWGKALSCSEEEKCERSQAVRRRIEKQFSVSALAQKTQDAFLSILEEAPP